MTWGSDSIPVTYLHVLCASYFTKLCLLWGASTYSAGQLWGPGERLAKFFHTGPHPWCRGHWLVSSEAGTSKVPVHLHVVPTHSCGCWHVRRAPWGIWEHGCRCPWEGAPRWLLSPSHLTFSNGNGKYPPSVSSQIHTEWLFQKTTLIFTQNYQISDACDKYYCNC